MPSSSLPLLGPPDAPVERARLAGRGFAWWDAHLLDEHGNGVVLWWGFGLPEARLDDVTQPAAAVPSLSMLVMAGGEPSFWLHQRYNESDAAWEAPAGRWRFGRNQVEALRDIKAQVVIARFDCALPGTRSRLVGHVEMGGVPRRTSNDSARGDDEWAPLMGPGEGRAILSVGDDARFHLQGRAYHQRHGRELPFDDDGVVLWGTALFPESSRAYQVRVTPEGELEASGVIVHDDGRTELHASLAVELEGTPSSWQTLTLREGEEPWLRIQRQRVVHAREVGSTSLVRCRAPMLLPAPGIVHELDVGALLDGRRRAGARAYLHHASGPNPLRVRLTTGTQHRRWRRVLPF